MKAEPTPEMIAMARRIHAEHDPDKAYQYLDGSRDDYPSVKATLAAIIETTEKAAALLREAAAKGVLNGEVWVLHRCADAIESAAHLKEQGNAE